MATTIRTTTVTVNAAFLQEIKEVNAELWQLLDRLRAICRTAAAVQAEADRLVNHLVELRDQLALHFALEEAYGYFEEPALIVPSVAHQAAALRAEHRQLFALACELSDAAERLWKSGRLADFVTQIPVQFWDFDNRLRRHESCENEMIMRQFDDVGVGD